MVQDGGHRAESPEQESQPTGPVTHERGRGDDAATQEARDAARADRGRPVVPTRVSTVWAMLGVGLVLLAAILVFILQNGRQVQVNFLTAHPTLPLGVALLFAVLLGALLVLVVGAARMVQLRRLWRARRRAGQKS
ncbi:MAG TPA: lipopolysaccharide assembly protein LapA domain-containing protein [Actinomycetes bacterium]|jgi:uncharacterized integral membrane protein|nr:lipopolysaccharide assembly protein LapA domain-containing protein [Actinomycetes bacterium]